MIGLRGGAVGETGPQLTLAGMEALVKWENRMKYSKCGVWLFLGSLVYAVVRYNVFGEVAWVNVPVYVCNKAVSWTGLVLFGLSVISREKEDRRGYGALAAALIGLHVVMSLVAMNPAYFTKLYGATGRMNGAGELSMLAGTVGVAFLGGLLALHVQGPGEGTSLRAGWGRAVLWLSGAHVAVMGFAGWLTPAKWPGYMPPITMISFLTAAWFLYRRRRLG